MGWRPRVRTNGWQLLEAVYISKLQNNKVLREDFSGAVCNVFSAPGRAGSKL